MGQFAGRGARDGINVRRDVKSFRKTYSLLFSNCARTAMMYIVRGFFFFLIIQVKLIKECVLKKRGRRREASLQICLGAKRQELVPIISSGADRGPAPSPSSL